MHTDLPEVVPACQVSLRGERIATPVCALARNDMQKEGRVRGCKDAARKVRGNMPGVSGGKGVLPSEFVDRYDFALSTASRFVVLQGETDCRVAVHPPRSSQ